MKKPLLLLGTLLLFVHLQAQDKMWSESDRKYLLDNLIRSKEDLIKETSNLTEAQLRFHESNDRWSINEVVEHLARYEMIFDNEISMSLRRGKRPELAKNAKADSSFLNFIMEHKKHYTLEYTKPFSFTVPMGLNSNEANLAWFVKMRNESIDFLKNTNEDLRAYFNDWGNIHQIYIYTFGHIDRQMRQIKKIKQHPNYPK